MAHPRPAKFDVAHAEVDAARAKRVPLAKRVSLLFLPESRLSDRLPKPTRRCTGCGYLVQGACATCDREQPAPHGET